MAFVQAAGLSFAAGSMLAGCHVLGLDVDECFFSMKR